MTFRSIVDVDTLAANLGNSDWVVVDCRFDLADTEAGRRAYLAAHIPGAVYAHLDEDLSGPPATDHGRHPLPTAQALRELFGRLGIQGGKQVVAYDSGSGGIAARLWWLLQYMGHQEAAVLDGGWAAWRGAGMPATSGVEANEPATFTGKPRRDRLVLRHEVAGVEHLIDSRAPERYRGEVEPLDPVAGHIPGAVNYHYGRNLDDTGHFHTPAVLRQQLAEAVGDASPEAVVFYCGSGVTACHNILAQVHAGMAPGRLYAGSWSEWCREAEKGA